MYSDTPTPSTFPIPGAPPDPTVLCFPVPLPPAPPQVYAPPSPHSSLSPQVEVPCSVAANPTSDLVFQWFFNTTLDYKVQTIITGTNIYDFTPRIS